MKPEIAMTNTLNRTAYTAILIISLAATAFLFWLIYFKPAATSDSATLEFLPALNAFLNAMSATALCFGFYFIRRREWRTHRNFMIAALSFSTLFLIGYITHHYLHGDTKFQGAGGIRYFYFAILISHVALSVLALPMILTTVFFTLTGRFGQHKRIARWTFPIWLYVSVTGVLVFALLKIFQS